jgi:hypothetical protein
LADCADGPAGAPAASGCAGFAGVGSAAVVSGVPRFTSEFVYTFVGELTVFRRSDSRRATSASETFSCAHAFPHVANAASAAMRHQHLRITDFLRTGANPAAEGSCKWSASQPRRSSIY